MEHRASLQELEDGLVSPIIYLVGEQVGEYLFRAPSVLYHIDIDGRDLTHNDIAETVHWMGVDTASGDGYPIGYCIGVFSLCHISPLFNG